MKTPPYHSSRTRSENRVRPDPITHDNSQQHTAADTPTGSNSSDRDLSAHSEPSLSISPDPTIDSNPTLLRTQQVYPSPLLEIHVISHDPISLPIRCTWQLTNSVTRTNITDDRISTRLLATYWQTVDTQSQENPHMRRLGLPRKEKVNQYKLPTNSNSKSTDLQKTKSNNFSWTHEMTTNNSYSNLLKV